MITVPAGGYNGFPSQLYGGVTTGGSAWSYLPGMSAWGGRARVPSSRQLAALAKGRAILAARRGGLVGGKGKRRYNSETLDDFNVKAPTSVSQAGLDKAVLEMARLKNKLFDEMGAGDPGASDLPSMYPMARKMARLKQYIDRATALGYEPSYDVPELTDREMQTLARLQASNLLSDQASIAMGPGTKKAIKNLIRQMHNVTLNNAELNTLMRQARKGIAQSNLDAEQYIARPNPFLNGQQAARAAAANRLAGINWNNPASGLQALQALGIYRPLPAVQGAPPGNQAGLPAQV